jgi:hypothetical protein
MARHIIRHSHSETTRLPWNCKQFRRPQRYPCSRDRRIVVAAELTRQLEPVHRSIRLLTSSATVSCIATVQAQAVQFAFLGSPSSRTRSGRSQFAPSICNLPPVISRFNKPRSLRLRPTGGSGSGFGFSAQDAALRKASFRSWCARLAMPDLNTGRGASIRVDTAILPATSSVPAGSRAGNS